jgi:predicted DCC family thiol-disulfide oxidoreductase YuxK
MKTDLHPAPYSIYPLTLLYDGACPVCSLEMDNLRARNAAGSLVLMDIAAPGFDAAAYGVSLQALNEEIHAVRPDGSHLIGLAALRAAYAAVGLGWVLKPTGWGPLAPVADWGYRLFARHRRRISAAAAPVINGVRAFRARRMAKRMQACQGGVCAVRSAEPGADK